MSMPQNIAAGIDELESYLSDLPFIRYVILASTMFYTWDFILTFSHEVKLWNTQWNVTKLLFFVNRYLALSSTIMATFYNLFKSPTISICDAYVSMELISGVLLSANIEIILMRRLFALFNYEKIVVIPITILYFVVFGSMIGMGVVDILDNTSGMNVFVGTCSGVYLGWFYLFWLPAMILDFILVALVGYRSMQHYLRVPDKTWSGAHLVRALARDSFIYFLCNFSVYLGEVLLFRLVPAPYVSLGASWILVIPSVAANHLLINMNTAQTHVHTDDKESFYTNSAHEIRRAT